MIFDIQGAWIDCVRNKVLGIYSFIVIINKKDTRSSYIYIYFKVI